MPTSRPSLSFFFFFNDTATTEIYTLSLHDALPISSLAGVMLTARLETGEANIGAAMPLRSIAACVIGGVSLRGGTGRLGSVVLGAVFIEWFENGMNLARIQSYLQMGVLGVLLIFAVVMDEVRHRYIAKSRED